MKNYKTYIIIALIAIVVIAGIAILILNKSVKKQQRIIHDKEMAIEKLNTRIAIDSMVIATKNMVFDSLKAKQKLSEIKIAELQKQKNKLNQDLLSEKQRVKELNAQESVEFFLEKADVGEFPVMQYDTTPDSTFIVPLQAIRQANDCFVTLPITQAQKSLVDAENALYKNANKTCNEMVENREQVIVTLNSTIDKKNQQQDVLQGIIDGKDKELKKQKVILRLNQAGAVVLIALALIF